MANANALLGCRSSGGKSEGSVEEELGMNSLAAEHVCLALGFEQEGKRDYFRQLHSATLVKSCLSDELIYIVLQHSFFESLPFMGSHLLSVHCSIA